MPSKTHPAVCLDSALNMVKLTIQINHYRSRPPDPCLGHQSPSPMKILIHPHPRKLHNFKGFKPLNHPLNPSFYILNKACVPGSETPRKYDFLNPFCIWLFLSPLFCHVVKAQWNLPRCQLHGVCTL